MNVGFENLCISMSTDLDSFIKYLRFMFTHKDESYTTSYMCCYIHMLFHTNVTSTKQCILALTVPMLVTNSKAEIEVKVASAWTHSEWL